LGLLFLYVAVDAGFFVWADYFLEYGAEEATTVGDGVDAFAAGIDWAGVAMDVGFRHDF
jgi:hypothetical protein